MCSGVSMVSYLRLYPCWQTTYFYDGLDPMGRTMRSIVYSRSSVAELLEIVRLVDRDAGTSDAEFACCLVGVSREGDKVVEVGIAGA